MDYKWPHKCGNHQSDTIGWVLLGDTVFGLCPVCIEQVGPAWEVVLYESREHIDYLTGKKKFSKKVRMFVEK